MFPETTNTLLVLENDSDARVKAIERRAQQAERLADIEQMAAVVVHEGRNILQRTMYYLEILASKITNRSELLDLVGRTRNAQKNLARLFDDLNCYPTPLRLRCEALYLRDVWREAWSDLNDLGQMKVGELQESVREDALSGDRFRLKQVFRNLFENALAACPSPAHIKIHCTQVSLPDGWPAIRVSVRDNGPGLSQEQQQRAFEPFYTTKSEGTGLGLAITKRIVEAHAGHISIGSSGSSGAEFVIVLPQENEMSSVVEPAQNSAGETSSKRPAPTAMARKNAQRRRRQLKTPGGLGQSAAAAFQK